MGFKYTDLFWWHTPNEGKRTPFEQYLFKKMGGLKGVTDFVILEESNFSKGLMMEIKTGVNICTVEQVDFLIRSAKRGYTTAVVYDHYQDALALVDKHLKSGICLPSEGIVLIKGGKQSIIPFEKAHEVLRKKTSKPKDDIKRSKSLFKARAKKRFGGTSGLEKLFKSSMN